MEGSGFFILVGFLYIYGKVRVSLLWLDGSGFCISVGMVGFLYLGLKVLVFISCLKGSLKWVKLKSLYLVGRF